MTIFASCLYEEKESLWQHQQRKLLLWYITRKPIIKHSNYLIYGKLYNPKESREKFTRPHCNTVSQMIYFSASWKQDKSWRRTPFGDCSLINVAICQNCDEAIIWIDNQYVYPEIAATEPNADMPNSVKLLYDEAVLIYNKSPRAACALLRLAVERLCNELGETGAIDK